MKVTKTGIAKHISDALADHEPPMTIKDLKEKTGIGLSKLKRIVSGEPDENGNKRLPNSDEIIDIAKALDISVYKLLTGNDDENHIVCEELGLSNDTINKLKHESTLNRPQIIHKAIDFLVSYPPILFDIYFYLTEDYQSIQAPGKYFTADDCDRIDRLSILDELKVLRQKVKGAGSNETGKR